MSLYSLLAYGYTKGHNSVMLLHRNFLLASSCSSHDGNSIDIQLPHDRQNGKPGN